MKFKMSERSLFATLLRAPWWVSFVVMAAVALLAGALLPEAYKIPGMLGAFPFFVIGVMAAWRQRHRLSPERIESLVELARGMGWRDFAQQIEHALRLQGFDVASLASGPADLRIEKAGRVILVSAKRWKAATVGVEHLRELLSSCDSTATDSCSCLSLGSFSPAALEFAREHGIQLLGPADVAQLLHDGARTKGLARH